MEKHSKDSVVCRSIHWRSWDAAPVWLASALGLVWKILLSEELSDAATGSPHRGCAWHLLESFLGHNFFGPYLHSPEIECWIYFLIWELSYVLGENMMWKSYRCRYQKFSADMFNLHRNTPPCQCTPGRSTLWWQGSRRALKRLSVTVLSFTEMSLCILLTRLYWRLLLCKVLFWVHPTTTTTTKLQIKTQKP